MYPSKAASVLEADHHQKIVMKFQLKDKTTGQLLTAHQTFIRLTNLNTKEEIIFITEADNTLTNKFDLVGTLKLFCVCCKVDISLVLLFIIMKAVKENWFPVIGFCYIVDACPLCCLFIIAEEDF